MTKKFYCVFIILVLAGMMLPTTSPASAQDSEGRTTEQSAAARPEKGNPENEGNFSENPMNFPAAQGPVKLRLARGTRITLKLTDASRAVYEAIGRQARISVLFDPDYSPRNISVDLNSASLPDALKIVAFQSQTFWRPVTSDTIFVAADTRVKRRDFEQQVIKTYYLPNITSPEDLQDIVNGVRALIEIPRIQMMAGYQTIMVRATPEQMAVTDKLVADLIQAKQKTGGQYRLEYKISEVNDAKQLAPKTYTLLIEPHQTGKLRIGSKISIQTGDKSETYVDVGKKIDCQVRSESEHSVSLRITVESSEVAQAEGGNGETSGANPEIQQATIETSVTLELGTPTVVGNFQDPVSRHSFQIEVTATRTKSKES